MIPHKAININDLNEFGKESLSEHLQMEVVDISAEHLSMRMPVHSKTHQPLGMLHGGAVAALAENVGSLAGNLVVPSNKACVGLSLNCNHIKTVRSGYVTAKARFVHLGKRTQIWEIETRDDHGDLVNLCTLTLAVIDKK